VKPLIPEGLYGGAIFEYMHSHGFKNRHSAVGPHLGMAITYFELVERQKEKNNGREQEWRAQALKDEIHQDSGSTKSAPSVEDDSSGHGKQRIAFGVRDSISVSNDARGTSSGSQDSEANGGAESRRRNPNGNAAGRSGVRDERPDPEAPLKVKLAYWRPRLMWREED
jgi:hypothetical protein